MNNIRVARELVKIAKELTSSRKMGTTFDKTFTGLTKRQLDKMDREIKTYITGEYDVKKHGNKYDIKLTDLSFYDFKGLTEMYEGFQISDSDKPQVKFVGIDDWNRPIFKDVKKKRYYGCTFELFDYDATEREVLKKIESDDLLYFGTSFGCEPMGTMANVNIIK